MYEIDELANIVPMAGEKEQNALMEDIRKHGQRELAVLWRGKLVDGRCRQLACATLGIELKVRTLDDKLSRGEVAAVVKSLNTRRNLTMTQKVISALKEQKRTGETNEKIANAWAIGIATLKNAKYVDINRPDLVDVLFDGKTAKLIDVEKGITVTTNKVNTIARLIKKQKEHDKVKIDTSGEIVFAVDGQIKTEAGKSWYYSTVNILGIKEPLVRMLIAELANLKFKQEKLDEQ